MKTQKAENFAFSAFPFTYFQKNSVLLTTAFDKVFHLSLLYLGQIEVRKRTFYAKAGEFRMDTMRNQADFKDVRKEKETILSKYIANLKAKEHPQREALVALFFAALAFVLMLPAAALPFGACVMGLALVCAASKRMPSVLLGSAAGLVLFGQAGLVYGCAYLLALGIRMLLSIPGKGRRLLPDSDGLFKEPLQLRACAACIAALSLGAYQMLAFGIMAESLLFAAVAVFACPALCLLFYGALEHAPTLEALLGKEPFAAQKSSARVYFKVGALALATAAFYSAREVRLFGVSVSLCLISALALFSAKRMGAFSGMVAGGVCALAVAPLHAPAFALLGLFCGVLWPLGAFFALGLGLCTGALWSSFIGGFSGFLEIFPAQGCAAVLTMPLLFAAKGKKEIKAEEKSAKELVKDFRAEQSQGIEMRMLRISNAFGSLSGILENYKKKESAPDVEACRAVCAEACTKRCGVCTSYDGCWAEENGAGQAMLASASEKMAACEPLGVDFVPAALRERCVDSDALAEDIRASAGQFLKEFAKTAISAPSLEYELLSSVIRDAVRFERAEAREDLYLGAEIEKVLREHGCKAESVSVFGRRQKQFYAMGVDAALSEKARKTLKAALEKAAKCALTDPVLCRIGGSQMLTFSSAKTLSVQSAVASKIADGEVVLGDSVRFFESEADRFYAVLSDGMGSGEKAAAISSLCTAFFEKTLSAGVTKNQAARLFHSLLRAGEDERSTTLDLFELDLLSGDGIFMKAGAAHSFVVRGGQMFRIRSKTIPLGLTGEPDTEKIRFKLEAGDLVVLFSDGICQTPEDAPWLQNILSEDLSEMELSAISARILSAAAENAKRCDDMTVATLRISDAQ